MLPSSKVLLSVLLLFTLPTAAMAWNSTGHRVVAIIAYKSMDDASIKRVATILKDNPLADTLWKGRDVNSSDDELVNLFLNAATFPDDVRPPSPLSKEFHHGPDHYVNFQLTDDGKIGPTIGDGNLLVSYQKNLDAVGTGMNAKDRAVALSWVFHQVGDAHQPLHAVARVSKKFSLSDGDRGGNLVKPFPDPRGKFQELHSYWDDLLGSDVDVDTFSDLESIVNDIMAEHTAKDLATEAKRLDINLWTEGEGGPLARDVVYMPLLKLIDNGNGFKTLPPDYEKNAQLVARRRVALAGYRLAEQLKSITAPGK